MKYFWKINLINYNEKSIKIFAKLIKSHTFLSQQILNWIYKHDKLKFNYMNNIKKYTKIILKKICVININKIKNEFISKDNTIKWIINLKNNKNIETVAIPNKKNHYTLCISSQIGCTLNCSFCYTGKQVFKRNLKTSEIISQIINSKKRIKNLFKKKITNIVFMGMGEPLFNIKNVLSTISIITNKNAFNLHKNKITISTAGIIPVINKLIKYKIPLAISLHSTNNESRSNLMKINKKFSIKNLIKTCEKYSKENSITIEYIMIKDINDTNKNISELINLLKNIKCKICLIPFNNFPLTKFNTSKKNKILYFKKILNENGFTTTIRQTFGNKINAACGQLTGAKNKQ